MFFHKFENIKPGMDLLAWGVPVGVHPLALARGGAGGGGGYFHDKAKN